MFEIDECPGDQQRNKDPVGDRQRPRKTLPDGEEKKSCEQFHGKIAKGDFAPAIGATTAKGEPTNQRQILMPGNRFLARWTKRAARLVYRKIERQAIDADVQKRADCGADNERKCAEEKLVNRIVHTISRQSISIYGATLSRKSRCSFRRAYTSGGTSSTTTVYTS